MRGPNVLPGHLPSAHAPKPNLKFGMMIRVSIRVTLCWEVGDEDIIIMRSLISENEIGFVNEDGKEVLECK